MEEVRNWLNKNSTKLIHELNSVQLAWVCHAMQKYANEVEDRGIEREKIIERHGSESYMDKFCTYHGESVESKKEGVLDCYAHLAEARVFTCRYKNKQAALDNCVDYQLSQRERSR